MGGQHQESSFCSAARKKGAREINAAFFSFSAYILRQRFCCGDITCCTEGSFFVLRVSSTSLPPFFEQPTPWMAHPHSPFRSPHKTKRTWHGVQGVKTQIEDGRKAQHDNCHLASLSLSLSLSQALPLIFSLLCILQSGTKLREVLSTELCKNNRSRKYYHVILRTYPHCRRIR